MGDHDDLESVITIAWNAQPLGYNLTVAILEVGYPLRGRYLRSDSWLRWEPPAAKRSATKRRASKPARPVN
jgi:hypothetical protein